MFDPVSFISSSNFKVSAGGAVSASSILIGDKVSDNYLQFIDDTLTVAGDFTVDNIRTPANIGGVAINRCKCIIFHIIGQEWPYFRSASIGNWNMSIQIQFIMMH